MYCSFTVFMTEANEFEEPTLMLTCGKDDYITRGVTLGGNSSAIATALLLVTDPRAAAFSNLAMGLFGTITVAFTSVPALAKIVAHLAGF
jgi:putative effector of murein hydrolase